MVVGGNGDLGQSSVLDARLGDDSLRDLTFTDARHRDTRLTDFLYVLV